MTEYIRRCGAPLALAAVVLAAACSRDGSAARDTTLAQDSSLTRDLQMANRDTSSQPQLKDVAPGTSSPRSATRRRTSSGGEASTRTRRPDRPAPTATNPAPAATTTPSGNTVTRGSAGSERAVGTIGSGSTVVLNSATRVCTNTNHVGDRVTATVAEAVTGSNGVTIPAGSTVTLEVTELHKSNNTNDKIQMGFGVRSVTINGRTYAVDADVTSAVVDRVRASSTTNDVEKVAGGAVIGAILGKVIGKSTKGTVIGAAAGAAAGTAAAAATADYDGCVANGGRMTIRLNAPLTVQVS